MKNIYYKMQFLILLALGFTLSACTCSGGKNRTDFELFHDMIKQQNIKPQEGDESGTFMRLPPENSRARNKKYYPYKGDPLRAEKNLKNPYADMLTAEMIGTGKRQYEKACIYCHGADGGGADGEGAGKIGQKMIIKPPSLLTDKVIAYSDGRIYHIIHEGQGLMGSHRKQVQGEKQRWALVNYVRMLQKQNLRKKTGE